MAIFQDWNPYLALMDTLWGGVLFTLVLYLYKIVIKFL